MGLSVPLFNTYLLSIHCGPGPVLSVKNLRVHQTVQVSHGIPLGFMFYGRRQSKRLSTHTLYQRKSALEKRKQVRELASAGDRAKICSLRDSGQQETVRGVRRGGMLHVVSVRQGRAVSRWIETCFRS